MFESFAKPIQKNRVFGYEFPDHPAEYFWRIESTVSRSDDAPVAAIHFERYALWRHTAKGVWVVPWGLRNATFRFQKEQNEKLKKFVLHSARRKHSYPTRSEAWRSFLIRQTHRVWHCRNALESAETVHDAAHEIDISNLIGETT